MWGFQRLGGAVFWYTAVVLRWYHATFVEPAVTWWLDNILGAWEEACKGFLRESFAAFTRLVNGTSAWVVSLFFKQGYYEAMRSRNQRPSAWQRWWAERGQSTFSAVLERDGLLARTSPSPVLGRLRRHSGRAASATPPPLSPRQRQQQQQQQQQQHGQPAGSHQQAPELAQRWYHFWRRRGGSSGAQADAGGDGPGDGGSGAARGGGGKRPRIKRSGSELFELPSGYGVATALPRRGLLEDTRLGLELGVTAVFEAMRTAVRAALFLPRQPAADAGEGGWIPGMGVSSGRPSATSRFEDLHVWTASDVILQAGYPLEEHIVTTSSGYILHMQRIPRKGARDVAFFMHGILDTSLGWVANGVVGSQAFAAWDAGHDVWLGNTRANPPRAHVDPDKQGAKYWRYSLNELGTEDVAAQVEHVHMVKTGELQSASVWRSAALEGSPSLAGLKAGLRRTASDSALLSRHRLELAAQRGWEDKGQQQQQPAEARGEEGQRPSPFLLSKQPGRGSLDEARRRLQPGLSLTLPTSPGEFQEAGEMMATARSSGSHGGPFRHFPFHPFRRRRSKQEAAHGQGQPGAAGQGGGPGPSASQSLQEQAQPSQPQQPEQQPEPGASPTSPSFSQQQQGQGLAAEIGTLAARQQLTSFAIELSSEGSSQEGLRWFDASEGPCSRSASSSTGSEVVGGGGDASCVPILCRACSSPSEAAGPPCVAWDDCARPSGAAASSASQWQAGGGDAASPSSAGAGGAMSVDAGLLTPDREAVQGVEHTPGTSPTAAGASSAPNTFPRAAAQGAGRRGAAAAAGASGTVPGLASLRSSSLASSAAEPYRLRAVGHSLGAGSLLIYAVVCRMLGRPHRLKRMVLLTPAGFHVKHPKVFVPFMYVVPLLVRALEWVRPGIGSPAYLPSSLLRYVTFKLSMDLDHIPGLNELTKAGISALLSGDKSQWDRALQMPHYNTYAMPAISFHSGDHFMQLMHTGRFQLYDYGSPAANAAHYGSPCPPNLADHYHLLADLPVDLVAGRQDGIIAAEDVGRHYQAMRSAGVQVSYKEFDVGHLDVIFAVKEEVRHYVLSRLQLREWG